jgi:hypothetical protein
MSPPYSGSGAACYALHFSFLFFFFSSFYIVSWGEVRLSPLGTSAANWPIVPSPDDM